MVKYLNEKQDSTRRLELGSRTGSRAIQLMIVSPHSLHTLVFLNACSNQKNNDLFNDCYFLFQ